jgi:hypothetical protein
MQTVPNCRFCSAYLAMFCTRAQQQRVFCVGFVRLLWQVSIAEFAPWHIKTERDEQEAVNSDRYYTGANVG